MLQKLSDELLIDSYVRAVNLKLDEYFIALLNEELYRRLICFDERIYDIVYKHFS
jgi:hypothetical protein